MDWPSKSSRILFSRGSARSNTWEPYSKCRSSRGWLNC